MPQTVIAIAAAVGYAASASVLLGFCEEHVVYPFCVISTLRRATCGLGGFAEIFTCGFQDAGLGATGSLLLLNLL